ncbi:hypothetical protein CcCBS67573_g01541 [Chytriomyces confervae]|uniref:Uncharacterized protein n=1 Tax=Chytriomyces confervae TaxID=246404 RepID=A0A507FNL2_9FUNG|nr:hypothetical protein CcCBS67573_g01541 [Chytriomyces confervae]
MSISETIRSRLRALIPVSLASASPPQSDSKEEIEYFAQPELGGTTPAKKRRYCHGRLSLCALVSILVAAFSLALSIVSYFFIIPAVIQSVIDNGGSGSSASNLDFSIQSISVNNFTKDSLQFGIQLSVGPFSIFPVSAGIGSFRIRVTDENSAELAALDVPDINIASASQPIKLDSIFTFSLASADVSVLTDLVANVTRSPGTSLYGRVFTAKFNVPIKLFGITLYSSLPLYKTLRFNKPNPNQTVDTSKLIDQVISLLTVPEDPALSKLVSANLPQELVSLSSKNGTSVPVAAFTNLAFEVSDTGLSVTLGANLNNPTVFSLNGIEYFDVGIQVQNAPITRVNVSGFSLNAGLQDFTVKTELTIATDDPKRSIDAISDGLSKALGGGTGLFVGIFGPVRIRPFAILETITKGLSFNVEASTVLSAIPATSNNSTVFTNAAIADALGKGKFNAKLTESAVKLDSSLFIPRPLPLPPKISFPYATGASLSSKNISLVSFKLSPIGINADKSTVGVDTGVEVDFANTMEAAEALANAINPIIAAKPEKSSIDITGLAIFKDSAATVPFAWIETLFGRSAPLFTVTVPAGAINTATLFASNASAYMGPSFLDSLPISIQNFKVSQTDATPGFEASGSVAVTKAGAFPSVLINLGFGSLDLTASGVPFGSALLPKGVIISNSSAETTFPISAQLLLPSDNLSKTDPALQAVADAITKKNAPSASVGISALKFGVSKESAIVTLSQLKAEISTELLKSFTQSTSGGKGLVRRVAAVALAKVESASLKINDASTIVVAANTTVTNPTPLTANIGKIQAAATINGMSLANFETSAISLQSGTAPLPLALQIQLSTKPADQVVIDALGSTAGQFITSVAQNSSKTVQFELDQAMIGVSGFAITNANNPNGDLNLFKNIKVQASLANFVPESTTANISATIFRPAMAPNLSRRAATVNAMVDLSALLPATSDTLTLLKDFKLQMMSVKIAALPGGSLELEAAVSYNNALPVTAVIPFAKLSFDMDGVENAFTGTASNLNFAPGQNIINPVFNIAFSKDSKLQNSIDSLTTAAFSGKPITNKLVLQSVTFGGSIDDQNMFLSNLNLDLSAAISMLKATNFTSDNGTSLLAGVKLPATLNSLMSTLQSASSGTSTNFQVGSVSVEMLADKTASFSTQVGMKLPFPATVDLGYVNVGALVSGNQLVDFQTSLVSSAGEGGATNFNVQALVKFQDDMATQFAVAKLANNFIQGNLTSSSVGVTNFMIGSSSTDFIGALSKVRASQQVDDFIKPDGAFDVAKLLLSNTTTAVGAKMMGNNFKIQNANISALPGKLFNIGTNIAIDLPMIANANIPALGANYALDSVPILKTQVNGFKASAGGAGLNVGLAFQDSGDLSSKLSTNVAQVLAGKGFQGTLQVSGASFGISQADGIKSFSQVVIPIKLASASSAMTQNLGSNILPLKLPATISDLMNAVTPSKGSTNASSFMVGAVGLSALPGKTIGFSTSVGMSLPFPASVNIGFVNVGAMVNSNQLLNLQTNLNSIPDESSTMMTFKINAALKFQDEMAVQNGVAKLVNNFLAGKLTESSVGFSNFSIGASSTDNIASFSQIGVSQDVDKIILPNGAFDVASILNMQTKATAEPAGGKMAFQLQNAQVSMAAGKQLNLATQANIALPFMVTADIPAVATKVAIDDVPMVNLQLNASLNSGAAYLGLAVNFQDSQAITDKISGLVSNFNSNKPLSGNAVISGAAFGSSSADIINTFAMVQVPVSLNSASEIAKQAVSGAAGKVDLNTMAVTLGPASVVTMPNKMLGLKASAGVPNIPISVNIPFSSISGGLDEVDVFSSQQALIAKNGSSMINLDAKATFPSNAAIQNKVGKFANTLIGKGIGNNIENFSVSGVKYGISDVDAVMMFSTVRVMVPSSSIINNKTVSMIMNAGMMSMGGLANNAKLQSANLDLGTARMINAGAMALLQGVNVNANANIGYVGLSTTLDGNSLAQISVPGTIVSPTDTGLMVSANAQITLQDSSDVQMSTLNVFNKLTGSKNQTTPTNVGGSNFVIGFSKDDVIDSFSKITANLPADATLQMLQAQISQMTANTTASSTANLVKIQSSDIGVASSTSLAANFAANIAGALPTKNISVNIPFIGAQIMINGQQFIAPVVNGFRVTDGVASAKAMLNFMQNDALVNQVANAGASILIPTIPKPANFNPAILAMGTGVVFGASQDFSFQTASKVVVAVDAAAMLRAAVNAPSGMMSAAAAMPNVNLVAKNSGILTSVQLQQALINFPFTNKLGDVAAQISYNVGGDPGKRIDIINAVVPLQQAQITSSPANLSANILVGDNNAVWGEVIPFLLESKPVTSNFYVSGVKLFSGAMGQSTSFGVFQNFQIMAPPVTANTQALNLNLGFKNLIAKNGLNVQVVPQLATNFRNTMPLQANLGQLALSLSDTSGNILTANSPGAITLQPATQGGMLANNSINANIPINLNPLTLFKRLGELANPKQNFQLAINLNQDDGTKIQWLSNILSNAPASVVNQLPQIIMAALGQNKAAMASLTGGGLIAGALGNSSTSAAGPIGIFKNLVKGVASLPVVNPFIPKVPNSSNNAADAGGKVPFFKKIGAALKSAGDKIKDDVASAI